MPKYFSHILAPFLVVGYFAIGLTVLLYYLVSANSHAGGRTSDQLTSLPTFASCSSLTDALKEAQKNTPSIGILKDLVALPQQTSTTAGRRVEESTSDYSTTNVQVAGVDEADIVKTDGTYIYTLSRNTLSIVLAYPANQAQLVSQTPLEIEAQDFFIGNERLAIFGSSSPDVITESSGSAKLLPPRNYNSFTAVQILDISKPSAPKLERTVEVEGSYLTSRMVGSQIYFVVNAYPDFSILDDTAPPIEIVPLYRDLKGSEVKTAFTPVAGCADIAYFPDVVAEQFITVASLDLSDDTSKLEKNTILGSGENVYASETSMYVAASEYAGRWWLGELLSNDAEEKTTVHVFDLQNGRVSYRGNLEAPGHVLNQFSMDEHNGYFRIATTVGEVSRVFNEDTASSSGIYVYGSDLKQVGAVDKLAPGEKIYSARFMGDRAYLVTFQKVDPLFVISLADPAHPTILGKLKIPGYSDYLHPYDENHIIGLGKDTVAAEEGNFSWYQGLKLALFDVTDVENPKELHKIVIGDRGSDSYALSDHKAFLFDKTRNLLVIPVLLAQLDPAVKAQAEEPNVYGDYTFQGAFVFDLTLEKGFVEKGRVTHYVSDETFKKSGYYYYGDGNSIKRSLYIGDQLYTISDNKILANALGDLSKTSEVSLCTENCDKEAFTVY